MSAVDEVRSELTRNYNAPTPPPMTTTTINNDTRNVMTTFLALASYDTIKKLLKWRRYG